MSMLLADRAANLDSFKIQQKRPTLKSAPAQFRLNGCYLEHILRTPGTRVLVRLSQCLEARSCEGCLFGESGWE
jgi:hypothetical protein